MAIGPFQLLMLGFSQPNFQGEIVRELERLRDNDLIRVIDALAVYKDALGNVSTSETSQLNPTEADDLGGLISDLVGLGKQVGSGAEITPRPDSTQNVGAISDEDIWDALAEIPKNCAAAMILIEHRWAIPLRDAVTRAGGFPLRAIGPPLSGNEKGTSRLFEIICGMASTRVF